MLEQRISQWEEELMQKGMLFGEEKGKAEGLLQQKIALFEMYMDRFETIPIEWVYFINCLDDPKIINQLTRAVYKVNSPQEFYDLLTSNL